MDSQPSQPNQEDVSVVPLPVSYQMDQVITKIPPTASPHLWVVKLLEEFLWGSASSRIKAQEGVKLS